MAFKSTLSKIKVLKGWFCTFGDRQTNRLSPARHRTAVKCDVVPPRWSAHEHRASSEHYKHRLLNLARYLLFQTSAQVALASKG